MKSDFEESLLIKKIKVNFNGNEKEIELILKYDLFLNKIANLFGFDKEKISNYIFYYYNNFNKITISNENDFENFKNNANNSNDIIIYIENIENSNNFNKIEDKNLNLENNNINNLINNNPINQNNNNINNNNNNINNNYINEKENKNIMNNINNNLNNKNFNSNISTNFNMNQNPNLNQNSNINQNSNVNQNINNNNLNSIQPLFQFNMTCVLCKKFPIMKTIYFCPWCRNFLCEECEEKTSIYHIHPLFKIKNSFQYDNALKININTIIESTKKE